MDYEYDVFISYRRLGAVPEWLSLHFVPLFERWLTTELSRPAAVFRDTSKESGLLPGQWVPDAIPDILRRSRVLVAVLSADYFNSRWCMSELKSMEARREHGPNVVTTIVFHDCISLPDHLLNTNPLVFRDFAYTTKSFKGTKEYVAFEREIKHLASGVAELIRSAPEWREFDWIETEPAPLQPKMVRFK
jgi:hypothetical protein